MVALSGSYPNRENNRELIEKILSDCEIIAEERHTSTEWVLNHFEDDVAAIHEEAEQVLRRLLARQLHRPLL